jgi:hypothetical protein
MRASSCTALLAFVFCSSSSLSQAQAPPSAQSATDVYHVMFVKAAPGQAAAVATELQQQDPKDSMAGHYLLLRHQEGDDWDYCIVHHMGAKATVDLTTAPAVPLPTRVWHKDTFVSGPSWPEFTRALLPAAAAGKAPNHVYVVGVHRAVPGHYPQLLELLKQPDPTAKVPIGSVLLMHLDGAPWQIMSIDRYDSWQDLGTARAAAIGANDNGWLEVRQHSADHVDTIADRVTPK